MNTEQKNKKSFFLPAVSLLTILLSFYGIYLLYLKAGLPFSYNSSAGTITAAEDNAYSLKGDTLFSISGFKAGEEHEIEYILDRRQAGDTVTAVFLIGGIQSERGIKLVREYSSYSFIIITFITGISFWAVALFVIIKKPEERTARMLFYMLLSFSFAIMTSPGKTGYLPEFSDYFMRCSHTVSYILGIVFLIHFAYLYTAEEQGYKVLPVRLAYITASVYSMFMSSVQIYSMLDEDLLRAELFNYCWKILLAMLSAGVLAAVLKFFLTFVNTKNKTTRTRLQWPLWGIFAGVLPYIFLYVIPSTAGAVSPVPEEYSMAFLVLVPVSFGIGVIKYRMFDIEIILRRSMLYSALSVILISVYFIIVFTLGKLISFGAGGLNSFYSLIAAFSIAFIFNPLRLFLKKAIDRTFYKVNYDFKKNVIEFSNSLMNPGTLGNLYSTILNEISRSIPVSKSGITIFPSNGSGAGEIISDDEGYRGIAGDESFLSLSEAGSETVIALPEKTDYKVKDSSLFRLMRRNSIDVILFLKPDRDSAIGCILMGDKLSGLRYTEPDTELLAAFSENAALAVSKLRLSEKLITKEIETKKLEDLNQMKSNFISGVSHELKTPLTSIQMFADTLMHSKRIGEARQKEYAGIIKGESERLTRLIDNILNFSKIERGIKIYNFENVCLNEIIDNVLNSMEYHLRKNSVTLKKDITSEKIRIEADSDAIAEALINLISNAVKYSPEMPTISVSLKRQDGQALITIEDNGIGIGKKDIDRIFDNFYRVQDDRTKHIGGTGIGLSIVKDVMEHHDGKASVSSVQGEGSSFTLFFNLKEN